ncbi:hypothetical protein GCM10022244_13820 [Streptomyces gulbargensis]|uniref:Uncharacterized protein n=1 Tax=Streptomyces gulbargensis TaxID=364901 RepID=A0ABP7LMJ1_9ACTN
MPLGGAPDLRAARTSVRLAGRAPSAVRVPVFPPARRDGLGDPERTYRVAEDVPLRGVCGRRALGRYQHVGLGFLAHPPRDHDPPAESKRTGARGRAGCVR